MKSLTCEHVLYLMPLYTDGKTSEEQSLAIEEHLSHCPRCFEKYLTLKNVAERIKAAFENIPESDFSCEKLFFENNLCAYIDNELEKTDYYAFNQYVTNHPESKKELEEMFLFDEKLKESIKNNKKILNKDLSKKIVNEVKRDNPTYIYELYIKAAVLTGIFVILTTLAGYFSIPDNIEKLSDFQNKILEIVVKK